MNETMTLKEGAEAIEGLYSFLFEQLHDCGVVALDENSSSFEDMDSVRAVVMKLVEYRWVTGDPNRMVGMPGGVPRAG